MKRTGLYYFTRLKQRVFFVRWYIARDLLSDFKSWCDLDGSTYWGLDLSPVLRSTLSGGRI